MIDDGIGHVMSCRAQRLFDAGQLVPVLADREPGSMPVQVVFRRQPPRGCAVRDVVDHAVPVLRRRLAEVEAAIAPIVAGGNDATRSSRATAAV